MPPDRFIPLFEKNGFIIRLDEYIWEQACITLRRWIDHGLTPTPICSPSIECLQAVCSPNKDALGKYYFFYFQNDKYTFSETYDEHQAAFS